MNGGEPRRLWSLWDMLELKAGAFFEATAELTSLASWIGATSIVGDSDAKENLIFHGDRKLEEIDRTYLGQRLTKLREHLNVIGAKVTLLALDELTERSAYNWMTWGYVKPNLEEIHNTLRRELSLLALVVLQPNEQAYFTPNQPLFGAEFAVKFISAGVFELDEAAKCLALSRPTASVFHLMRLMEIGLRVIAACLAIPDPVKPAERNWGKMLEKIRKDGIVARWPT